MKHTLQALLLLLLPLLSSCGSSDVLTALSGRWDVVQIDTLHIQPTDDSTPYLGLDLKKKLLYGFTGCNRLTGEIDPAALAAGRVDFSRIGCTRRLCQDDRYEAMLLTTLPAVCGLSISSPTELHLTDKQGNTLLVLRKN